MRTFNFKLTALLKLKEAQREQALVQFASSIKEVQKLEKKLAISQNKLDSVLSILHDRKKGTFRSDQIGPFIQALWWSGKNSPRTRSH